MSFRVGGLVVTITLTPDIMFITQVVAVKQPFPSIASSEMRNRLVCAPRWSHCQILAFIGITIRQAAQARINQAVVSISTITKCYIHFVNTWRRDLVLFPDLHWHRIFSDMVLQLAGHLVFYTFPWHCPHILMLLELCVKIRFFNRECWSYRTNRNWLRGKLHFPNFEIHTPRRTLAMSIPSRKSNLRGSSSTTMASITTARSLFRQKLTSPTLYVCVPLWTVKILMFLPQPTHFLVHYSVRAPRIHKCNTPFSAHIKFHWLKESKGGDDTLP